MSVPHRSSTLKETGRKTTPPPARFREALTIAEETGLLSGAKTQIVRGRMPDALVRKAKARSGARTSTELIELALANLATADMYADWLLSQKGTIDQDVDLEF